MDPFSITTGVFSLLGVCIKTGILLKDFYDGAASADIRIGGLLTDVESFTNVLQLMKDTLEQEDIQNSFQSTGHIGNHLKNLATSIRDGQKTLLQLQETIEKVNKSVNLLDGTRKHLRLRSATDEIAVYQQQIRSYRDTLQLTLQTLILWNQVTFREAADKILPNLDDIQQEVRRIALDLNGQIAGLQNVIESRSSNDELHTLNNLRNCVKSAASIVSSASTTLSAGNPNRRSVTLDSEFGDCFPSQPGETMLRWISSNTVYEFEEEKGSASSYSELKAASGKSLELVEGDTDQSDSDGELEAEIIQSLLRRGKDKLACKDYEAAERDFRNCLARTSSDGSTVSLHHLLGSKLEIMTLLLAAYRQQEKWDDARSLLTEKIGLESRGSSKTNKTVLEDTLVLVEVLIKKCAYSEALLYGRRALKSYRTLGPEGTPGVQKSLEFLCQICNAAGNHDEEDAYGAILSDYLLRTSPTGKVGSTTTLGGDIKSHGFMVSPEVSSLETRWPPQSPSARSDETFDTLRSDSTWTSQASSSTLTSAKAHRRHSSISSFGSSAAASPLTVYSPILTKPNEVLSKIKDVSSSNIDDTSKSESTISVPTPAEPTFMPMRDGVQSLSLLRTSEIPSGQRDCNDAFATSDSEKFMLPTVHSSQKTNTQQSTDAAITTTASAMTARQPSPFIKFERPERKIESPVGQIGPQIPQIQALYTPLISLPGASQLQNDSNPEISVTPAPAPSPNERPNVVLQPTKSKPSRLLTKRLNHGERYFEEAAIGYFRANKGVPPKATIPAIKKPVPPVSDYELLEWIGTHPNYPFTEAPEIVEPPMPLLALSSKTITKSKSAVDLFNSGIVELPAELYQRSKSSLSLRGPAIRDETGTDSVQHVTENINAGHADQIPATIPKDISNVIATTAIAKEDGIVSPSLIDLTSDDGILGNTMADDSDHLLATLIEMGYPRIVALSALEKFDLVLKGGMGEESRSPKSQTDIQHKRMGVFYVPKSPQTPQSQEQSSGQRSSSFELPTRPVSFHTPTLAVPSNSGWGGLGAPILSSPRSESSLAAKANSHKKNHSVDSGIPSIHVPITPEQHTARTEDWHNDRLTLGWELDKTRPRNPITVSTRWDDPNPWAGSMPVPDISITEPLPTESKHTRAVPELELPVASTRPAVNFSDMLAGEMSIRRKVVLCGDVFCGKSSLVSVFSKGTFPETYQSAELEIGTFLEQRGGQYVELGLWDTGGDLNYTAIRLECYPNAHVVVICFAIDSPDSLDNAEEMFAPEMKKAYSSPRYLLVGLKKDLRDDRETIDRLRGIGQHPVTLEEGQKVSIRIGAIRYMECSAKTYEGVTEVFEAVSRFAMLPTDKLKKARSFRRLFGKE